MARITRPKRGRKSAKRADLSILKEALKDGRIWVQLAIVQAHGTGSHWEKSSDGDLLVDVVTVPRGLQLVCRLGAAAGQVSAGLWRVPAVGTEVIVGVPDGELDHHPAILACLSSGATPARAGDGQTLLAAPDAIEMDAPAIRVGGEHADQEQIRGTEYLDAETKMMIDDPTNNLLQAFNLLQAAAVGPLAALKPGFIMAQVALTAYQATSTAKNNFRSTVIKVR